MDNTFIVVMYFCHLSFLSICFLENFIGDYIFNKYNAMV